MGFHRKGSCRNVSDNVTQDNASLITMDTSAPVISGVMFVSDNSKILIMPKLVTILSLLMKPMKRLIVQSWF